MSASRRSPRMTDRLKACTMVFCGLAFIATAANSQTASPFPVRHGINIAGAYARTISFPRPQANGQVSDYQTFVRAPAAYAPADLRSMGFDFVRFVVNPAPLLENPPPVRGKLLLETEAGFQPYLAQGMRVIYDLHFWNPAHRRYTNAAVTTGSPAVIGEYRALVSEIATRLAKYPTGQVALELLNEPDNRVCSDAGWLRLQSDLVRVVRRAAPRLPVLVTGCNDRIEATAAISAANTDLRDPDLIFTFHYYDPVLFTVQGQAVGDYAYLRDVPYPANRGGERDTLAQTFAAIDAAHLSFLASASAKMWAVKQIHDYFADAYGPERIQMRMDMMARWAKANGIPASRLIIGEFGAQAPPHIDSAAAMKARLTWDQQVQAAADARGMASAYWALPSTRTSIFH